MSDDTQTPNKRLKVGDRVWVIGHENQGSRKIARLYKQEDIPGGVVLDVGVDVSEPNDMIDPFPFRSWNEDELYKDEEGP